MAYDVAMRIQSFRWRSWRLVAAPAAQSPDATVRGHRRRAEVQGRPSAFIQSDHDRFVRELIALTEIPAPPFKEQARAKAFMEMLRQQGLSDVEMDAEGNVMGIRRGTGAAGGPCCVVNAHLDTVFPEGTDVKVKREGTRLSAPGIGDDTRGLALILALVRTLDAAKFTTPATSSSSATSAKKGEGDLRGIKFLLKQGKYKDRIKQMLAIDGNESSSVTRGGVGSKRYRVTFKGPGGHSYGAFGLVNPAFAMGSAMAKFGRLEVPASPKTTYSVGVVRGGTSVNSIPVGREHGRRPAIRGVRRAEEDRRRLSRGRARGGGRREQDAIDEGRARSRPIRRSSASGRAARRRRARRSSSPPPPRSGPSA